MPDVSSTLEEVKHVVKFITNHQKSQSLYRERAQAAADVQGVKVLELLKYGMHLLY